MAAGLGGPLHDAMLATAAASGLDLATAIEGADSTLRATDVAQPALLLVEVALAQALPEDLDIVGVAGHSVGEYSAATIAGALDPETAMRLVVERGRAMAAMHDGVMSALLGLDADSVARICATVATSARGEVVVANINAPAQIVISGTADAVSAAEDMARAQGARRVVRLNVSGAFHSPLMRDAAERFAPLLDAAPMTDAAAAVVCNVDASAVTEAEQLRARLRAQLTSPVRWTECIAQLIALGADVLVEVGPQSVLTGLARRIAPHVKAVSVSTPAQAHTLRAAVGAA